MGVYLRDIPLLLIVAFTLVTTLVWGRVFCGFLCPFGALQDFIDRFVPKSLKRPLTQAIHDKAVYAKYVVLAVIVLPALAGSRVSLYQYFEPFGTVFFLVVVPGGQFQSPSSSIYSWQFGQEFRVFVGQPAMARTAKKKRASKKAKVARVPKWLAMLNRAHAEFSATGKSRCAI